jgi:hypothetical protein
MLSKNYLLLIAYLFIGTHLLAQVKQQTVVSKIEKVTLYTNGAQVSRKASCTVAAGKTELLFSGISPDIDKQSIQVKGDGKFTILSVTHQINYLNEQTRRQEIAKVEQQNYALLQKITVERNLQAILVKEEQMLDKNQSIGSSNNGVKTVDLKEAVDFQRARLTDIYTKRLEIDGNLQRLDSTIKKNNLQLKALLQPKNYHTSEILVTVQSTSQSAASFDVKYFIQKAGWYATYDVNVKDISHPIDLGFKANVYQNSGEDWKDVKLTISNGNPKENGVAPTLQPWYLRFGSVQSQALVEKQNEVSGRIFDAKDGSALPGVTVMVKGSRIGTSTDVNGDFALKLPNNASTIQVNYVGYEPKEMPISTGKMAVYLNQSTQQLSEVVVVGYGSGSYERDGYAEKRNVSSSLAGRASGVQIRGASSAPISSIQLQTKETYQPTTINYEIELPYTILNDGKTYAVDIKNISIPAIFEYVAVPKFEKDAFLKAKIVDWQDLNLIEGEINLFFEGAYLGKSILDVSNAGDTLNLSLGRDKSITVERKKLKEFTNKQFFSSNKTDNRAYEIIIHNNKQEAINITVLDQFPISTVKEITVDEQEVSGGSVDVDTKIITWKLVVEAKQEKKVIVKYAVKYPKNQLLILE